MRLVARTAGVGFVLLIATVGAISQSVREAPEFEAATVKISNGTDRTGNTFGGPDGRVVLGDICLRDLIVVSYRVLPQQIVAPGWMVSDHFDVVAKAPPNTSDDDIRLMLQKLVTERFKLKFHEEEKDEQVYALIVGRQGAHLTPSDGSHQTICDGGRQPDGHIHRECMNMSVLQFANVLRSLAPAYVDRPVIDLTGIAGRYDFILDWAPSQTASNPGEPTPTLGSSTDFPALFAALEKQLGLALTGERHPIRTIVVDSAERTPTEN